jgi:putative thioredoxin
LQEAAASDPDNWRISLTHAKLLLRAADYEGARRVLARLPAEERNQREASGMLAHLDFLQAAQRAQDPAELVEAIARNPRDMEARFRLTAVRLLEDDYPGAMDQMLEILRAAPDFREGAARRGLLAVFDLLGSDHELVTRYRARLFEISGWPAAPHEP